MIQEIIEKKLNDVFYPEYLEVINESYMHNVAEGSESHFKVIVVSASFKNKMLLQRHRAINMTLADELAGKVHALSIHTYTPSEWARLDGEVRKSPDCLG